MTYFGGPFRNAPVCDLVLVLKFRWFKHCHVFWARLFRSLLSTRFLASLGAKCQVLWSTCGPWDASPRWGKLRHNMACRSSETQVLAKNSMEIHLQWGDFSCASRGQLHMAQQEKHQFYLPSNSCFCRGGWTHGLTPRFRARFSITPPTVIQHSHPLEGCFQGWLSGVYKIRPTHNCVVFSNSSLGRRFREGLPVTNHRFGPYTTFWSLRNREQWHITVLQQSWC